MCLKLKLKYFLILSFLPFLSSRVTIQSSRDTISGIDTSNQETISSVNESTTNMNDFKGIPH